MARICAMHAVDEVPALIRSGQHVGALVRNPIVLCMGATGRHLCELRALVGADSGKYCSIFGMERKWCVQ